MNYHKGYGFKMQKEKYKYEDDINWDKCPHTRTKIFEVKPEWQEDSVSIVVECKDCTRIGMADGEVIYGEVQWLE